MIFRKKTFRCQFFPKHRSTHVGRSENDPAAGWINLWDLLCPQLDLVALAWCFNVFFCLFFAAERVGTHHFFKKGTEFMCFIEFMCLCWYVVFYSKKYYQLKGRFSQPILRANRIKCDLGDGDQSTNSKSLALHKSLLKKPLWLRMRMQTQHRAHFFFSKGHWAVFLDNSTVKVSWPHEKRAKRVHSMTGRKRRQNFSTLRMAICVHGRTRVKWRSSQRNEQTAVL